MTLSQIASTLFVFALAILPTIIASLVSAPRDWEPKKEHNYR